MGREYLWIYDGCCPKLRRGREYLLMGRKNEVRLGKRSKKDNPKKHIKKLENGVEANWRFETQLFLDQTDYWHPWRQKFSNGMIRLTQKLKCKKLKRRKILT